MWVNFVQVLLEQSLLSQDGVFDYELEQAGNVVSIEMMCFAQLTYRESLYNVPACQDTKLKNLSYILLPFLSAYAAIRYC